MRRKLYLGLATFVGVSTILEMIMIGVDKLPITKLNYILTDAMIVLCMLYMISVEVVHKNMVEKDGN